MRFYRYFFWVCAILHGALSLWFCFAPQAVKEAMDHSASTPLILTQLSGLFFFITACGFAYAAERPEKAVGVMALATLTKTLMPLFAWVGYLNMELSLTHLQFELSLDLFILPFLGSFFWWYYHKPRPNRFVPLIGLFGQKK